MDYDNWDTYRHLDIDRYIEAGSGDGRPTIIREEFGTISTLASIERFVNACIRSKLLPALTFNLERDESPRTRRSLASFYSLTNAMIATYDETYVYSPRVDIFFQACNLLSLTNDEFSFDRDPLEINVWTGQSYQNTFNVLVEKVRQLCGKSKFKAKLRQHENSVKRRAAKALMWERRLFDEKSRHLIIPLTLEYKPEFRRNVTPELVQTDLHHLLGNRRSNNLLAGIKNYVWRIEEGDWVGLHIHLLIAYDGGSREDMTISKGICNYWEGLITEGRGVAKSASMYKLSGAGRTYGACAGQIDQGDHEKREGLRKSLLYLTKADQFLKRKSSARYKTFGMSQPAEHSGMGRPRGSASNKMLTSE